MQLPDLPLEGGCRCGRVRFRIDRPPVMTAVCHCVECQHMSASAFSTTVMVPADAFTVVTGETVVGGIHGGQGQHNHCDWCKSWLFTRVPPEMGVVNVRATLLDDAHWFTPFAETYTSEKLPWVTTPAVRSFAKFPDPADYPGLLEDFAAT